MPSERPEITSFVTVPFPLLHLAPIESNALLREGVPHFPAEAMRDFSRGPLAIWENPGFIFRTSFSGILGVVRDNA
jgi:hypothetical protein